MERSIDINLYGKLVLKLCMKGVYGQVDHAQELMRGLKYDLFSLILTSVHVIRRHVPPHLRIFMYQIVWNVGTLIPQTCNADV